MKKCSRCHQDKTESDFGWKNKKKNRYQSHCKECQNQYYRDNYEKNKQLYIANAYIQKNKIRRRKRKWVYDYKLANPCACGESDPICLDFHHLEDKIDTIARLVNASISLERVKSEVKKCIVVCSNCHRKIHALEKLKRKSIESDDT